MSDSTGRIVGAGHTAPIMITDDHKSTGAKLFQPDSQDIEASSATPNIPTKPGSKRKHADGFDSSKKRARSTLESATASPRSSIASLDSPSAIPTREASPAHMFNHSFASLASASPSTPPTSDGSHLELPLLPLTSALSPSMGDNADPMLGQAFSPTIFFPTTPPSPGVIPSNVFAQNITPSAAMPQYPFMFFQPTQSSLATPKPKVHRLIPAQGPTHGGIEVTVLGANFLAGMQLDCVFGDAVASSTHRWSENTLVCVLPPRTSSGVVEVWFKGLAKDEDSSPPCLFTYTDESDRSL
jgi:uncharacterized protein